MLNLPMPTSRSPRRLRLALTVPLIAVALTACGTVQATSPGDEPLAAWQSQMATASAPAATASPTPKATSTATATTAPTAKEPAKASPRPTATVTVTATATATATVTPAPAQSQAQAPAVSPAALETPESTALVGWRVVQDANLRSGPDDSYPVIGTVHAGDQVRVLNAHRGWMKLTTGGWVYKAYLAR